MRRVAAPTTAAADLLQLLSEIQLNDPFANLLHETNENSRVLYR